jgi:hypothetical protein
MDAERGRKLQDLVAIEIANTVATAGGQGFSGREALSGLAAGASQALEAQDATDGSASTETTSLPAGPHSTPALVDKQKTPGTGALPNAGAVSWRRLIASDGSAEDAGIQRNLPLSSA